MQKNALLDEGKLSRRIAQQKRNRQTTEPGTIDTRVGAAKHGPQKSTASWKLQQSTIWLVPLKAFLAISPLRWFAAVLSGVLLSLCFPPWDQGWLCWIALTPLIWAIWLAKSEPQPKGNLFQTFTLGYTTGLTFFGLTHYWIYLVTLGGTIGLILYLAVYFGLWALFIGSVAYPRGKWRSFEGRTAPRGPHLTAISEKKPVWLSSSHNLYLAILSALAWVGLEWLRGILFTGFSWNGLGVALHQNIVLAQIADVVGTTGLAFPIVMANAVAVATLQRFAMEIGRVKIRPHFDFSLTMLLVVLIFAYGIRSFKKAQTQEVNPVSFALIQPNIPQNQKWDEDYALFIMRRYAFLTQSAAALSPQLLIWPETATPGAFYSHRPSYDFVMETARLGRFSFLFGSVYDVYPESSGGIVRSFNSAFLITDRDKPPAFYNKVHLVPFGEYVPFRHSFPLFAWIVGELLPSDFSFGNDFAPLKMTDPPVKIAPLICFEDTIGRLSRQFILRGGQLFVNLTNDGWFYTSPASQQHLLNARFRCIENRRPMLRCANTGVSCSIDSLGQVIQQLEGENGKTSIDGFLLGETDVPLAGELTFFSRYGDVFSVTALFLSMALSIRHIFSTIRAVPRVEE